MSTDPQLLRCEAFTEIGQTLERDAGFIIERWSRRAAIEQPSAARVHHRELLDGLVVLLQELGRWLAEKGAPDNGRHHLKALEHGEQRWESGWSLSEVVRDYQILRLVVLVYLEEALERPLSSAEIMAFGMALDEAITASVVMYVRFRDERLQHIENEHAQQRRVAAATIHRWEKVFENVGWGLALFDADTLRMAVVNPAFARMHGAAAADLIERPITELVAPEHLTQLSLELRAAEREGHRTFQCTQLSRSGARIPVAVAVTMLNHDAALGRYFAASFVDSSDRQHLEDALREKAESLEQADNRKDEFFALLAHELRNPLAPILHALELIRLSGDEPETVGAALATAERQVSQLARLVDDLLDVARISQGKIELRRQRFDTAEAVNGAIESCRPLIDDLQHHLDVSLPPEPIYLEADPARVQQILINLLNNAAKYTPTGGNIALEVEREDKSAVLRVRDSGVGIGAELLPRVFDLFTQAAEAADRSAGGLGVGLTLVRRLAELHGGQVSVASAGAGHGSEFTIRLPAEPHQQLEKATVSEPKHSARKTRLLLVDDNKDVVAMLALLLRRVGHEVSVAHDGLEALEVTKREKPEVVLLDIGLPGMSGYDVAVQIRSQGKSDSPVLIAMTGYGQEDDVRKAEEVGFQHHLLKPVRLDAIEDALVRLLGRSDKAAE